MIGQKISEERHVLPRWRSIQQAMLSGELDSVSHNPKNSGFWQRTSADAQKRLLRDFEAARENWRLWSDTCNRDILLELALLTENSDHPDVLMAASSALSRDSTPPSITGFAHEVVHGASVIEGSSLPRRSGAVASALRARKMWLSHNPRDGLLAAEMALLHANIGQIGKSYRYMERAIRTCPNDRYVLRSAVRFFCHAGDPERAVETIRRSPRFLVDPWLRSAELAAAALGGEDPKGWKKAKALANNDNLSLLCRSELAAQIGTFEMAAGAQKAAIRALKASARRPTENAIAQIEHVGRETELFEPTNIVSDLSSSHEATAHAAYWGNKWETALQACEAWFEEEPFSTRPAIFASFVASVQSSSLQRGLALAQMALEANPGDSVLINNISVILAYQGEIEAARMFLDRLHPSSAIEDRVTNLATRGLIELRSGSFDTGTELYKEAIKLAVRENKTVAAVRAYAFLGREVSRGSKELAEKFSKGIDAAVKKMRLIGLGVPREITVIRNQIGDVTPQVDIPQNLVQGDLLQEL